MERQYFNWLCLVILCVILVVVVIVLMRPCPVAPPCPDPCNGVPIEKADHWIAIHDALVYVAGSDENSASCGPPPIGQEVAWLPGCLHVKKGETIGFYNFHKNKITVEHFSSLNAPASFDVDPNSYEVFEVVLQGTLINFNFESTSDHGGPKMIIDP